MDRVAPELFEMITRFLPVTDVKNLRLVCKSFAELAARPLFKTVQIHALLASFEKFKIISQHETYRKYVQILIFYFDIFNPAEADSGLAFVAAFEQWRYKIKEVTSRYRTRRRSKEPLPYECSFELPSLAMEDELCLYEELDEKTFEAEFWAQDQTEMAGVFTGYTKTAIEWRFQAYKKAVEDQRLVQRNFSLLLTTILPKLPNVSAVLRDSICRYGSKMRRRCSTCLQKHLVVERTVTEESECSLFSSGLEFSAAPFYSFHHSSMMLLCLSTGTHPARLRPEPFESEWTVKLLQGLHSSKLRVRKLDLGLWPDMGLSALSFLSQFSPDIPRWYLGSTTTVGNIELLKVNAAVSEPTGIQAERREFIGNNLTNLERLFTSISCGGRPLRELTLVLGEDFLATERVNYECRVPQLTQYFNDENWKRLASGGLARTCLRHFAPTLEKLDLSFMQNFTSRRVFRDLLGIPRAQLNSSETANAATNNETPENNETTQRMILFPRLTHLALRFGTLFVGIDDFLAFLLPHMRPSSIFGPSVGLQHLRLSGITLCHGSWRRVFESLRVGFDTGAAAIDEDGYEVIWRDPVEIASIWAQGSINNAPGTSEAAPTLNAFSPRYAGTLGSSGLTPFNTNPSSSTSVAPATQTHHIQLQSFVVHNLRLCPTKQAFRHFPENVTPIPAGELGSLFVLINCSLLISEIDISHAIDYVLGCKDNWMQVLEALDDGDSETITLPYKHVLMQEGF